MIQLGKVTGQEIKQNRGTDINVRMLQVQLSNESDIQSVEYIPLSGDDNPPKKDDKVVVIGIGSAFKIAIGVRDAVVTAMAAGERKLYSRDGNGDIAAFINLLTDGNINLNGDAYSAVRFEELKTSFDAFVLWAQTHTHPTPPGESNPPTQPLNVDVDDAKVPTVTVP
jgi:hypothetical protein